MESRELLLVGSLLVLPAIGFLAGAWYFKKVGDDKIVRPVHEYALGGVRFRFSSLDGMRVVYLLLLFGWLDVFLPLGIAILLVGIAGLAIGTVRKLSGALTSDDTQKLLEKLSSIQNEISGAQGHVKTLSEVILTKQTQVDDRERAKRDLDELIRKKSEEAKGWNEQTEAQRQAFLETAVSAMSKESRPTFWWGLVLGFVINILATLTWTLLGNPGKDEILEKFKEVGKVFQRDAEQRVPPDRPQAGGR